MSARHVRPGTSTTAARRLQALPFLSKAAWTDLPAVLLRRLGVALPYSSLRYPPLHKVNSCLMELLSVLMLNGTCPHMAPLCCRAGILRASVRSW